MLKQKLFKPLDLIIYVNIFIFCASGIYGINTSVSLTILFLILSFFNIVFIIYTIKLRIEYNKKFIETISNEIKIETKMSLEKKDEYNKAKQVFLESRIEAEISNKIHGVKVIRNAYVPRSDGTTSEIDLIAISTKGIFVIESKNITGKIVGSWKQNNLILEHPGGETFNMSNPINQNTQHFYRLRSFLGLNNDIFRSIIVFSDLSYIESYKDVPYFAQICKLDNLIYSMNKLSKRFGTTLEEHMVNSIYENLLSLVEKDENKEKDHLSRVKPL